MSNDVWMQLVEWTCSDDEQNIIILVYVAPDGTRYHRKERSLTSFESDMRDTYVAADVPEDELDRVTDEETREPYIVATIETAGSHEPIDAVQNQTVDSVHRRERK